MQRRQQQGNGLSLAVQCSVDRWPRAQRLLRTAVPGAHVAVAVLLRGDAGNGRDDDEVGVGVETTEWQARWTVLELRLRRPSPWYPINAMRNRALQCMGAEDQLILSLDVDFLPSAAVWDIAALGRPPSTLQDETAGAEGTEHAYAQLVREVILSGPVAVILPAFELLDANEDPTPLLGRDKDALVAAVRDGRVRPFAEHIYPVGHRMTDYERWYTTTDQAPCCVPYEPGAEPFYIVASQFLPPFDERFVGYGRNKVAHAMHLDALGFAFAVHPSAWILHLPHAASRDCDATLGENENASTRLRDIKILYEQARSEIQRSPVLLPPSFRCGLVPLATTRLRRRNCIREIEPTTATERSVLDALLDTSREAMENLIRSCTLHEDAKEEELDSKDGNEDNNDGDDSSEGDDIGAPQFHLDLPAWSAAVLPMTSALDMGTLCAMAQRFPVPTLRRTAVFARSSEANTATAAVELVTHCSVDRLSQLQRLVASWAGPVACAVILGMGNSITRNWYRQWHESREQGRLLEDMAEWHRSVCDKVTLHVFELDTTTAQDRGYPFNAARNRAIEAAVADTILLLDVDFAVAADVSKWLFGDTSADSTEAVAAAESHRCELAARLTSGSGRYIVLPAFELNLDIGAATTTSTVADPDHASDLSTLRQAVHAGVLRPFHADAFAVGHRAEDWLRWTSEGADDETEADWAYPLQYEDGFEPYAFLPKHLLPSLDERFWGLPGDKVSFFWHLNTLGFTGSVMRQGCVLALATAVSPSTTATALDWKARASCKHIWFQVCSQPWAEQQNWQAVDEDQGILSGVAYVLRNAWVDAPLAPVKGQPRHASEGLMQRFQREVRMSVAAASTNGDGDGGTSTLLPLSKQSRMLLRGERDASHETVLEGLCPWRIRPGLLPTPGDALGDPLASNHATEIAELVGSKGRHNMRLLRGSDAAMQVALLAGSTSPQASLSRNLAVSGMALRALLPSTALRSVVLRYWVEFPPADVFDFVAGGRLPGLSLAGGAIATCFRWQRDGQVVLEVNTKANRIRCKRGLARFFRGARIELQQSVAVLPDHVETMGWVNGVELDTLHAHLPGRSSSWLKEFDAACASPGANAVQLNVFYTGDVTNAAETPQRGTHIRLGGYEIFGDTRAR